MQEEPKTQWMTVKEFAQAAGMTQQRVSQLLHKSLQEFHKRENGRIYIDSEALRIVEQARERQGYKPNHERLVKTCKEFEAQAEAATAAALDALRDQISRQAAELDMVRGQLDSVTEQLAEAKRAAAVTAAELDAAQQRADDAEARERASDQRTTEQLAAKDRQIEAITEALQTAQRAQNELAAALTAAQALHAGTIRGQLETSSDAVNADQTGGGDQTVNRRRGFLARLFNRRKEKG